MGWSDVGSDPAIRVWCLPWSVRPAPGLGTSKGRSRAQGHGLLGFPSENDGRDVLDVRGDWFRQEAGAKSAAGRGAQGLPGSVSVPLVLPDTLCNTLEGLQDAL